MAKLNIVHYVGGRHFEVWADVPGAELNGIIVGIGETRDAAVADAVLTLEKLTDLLQAPPSIAWTHDEERFHLQGRSDEFTIETHEGDI